MINDRWTQTARSAREQLQDRLKVYKRIGEIYADYSKGDRAVGAYETLYCTDEYNKAYKEYIDAVGLDEADCPWTGMASNEAKIENMAIMIEPRKYSTEEESDGEYTVMVQFGGANGKDGDRVCVMMAPAGDTYKIANFGTVDEEEGGGYYVNEAFTQVMEVAIDEKKMEKEGEEMWRRTNERGTKEVSNGKEFVEALTEGKSNIAIAEGAVINLTEVLSDAEYFKKDGRYDLGDDETIAEVKARVIREEMPDGSQLTLKGLERYKIEGRGKGATLLIDSRYARVLSFVDCQYIQIENLTLGHTQGGSCLGEVLSLQNVKGCKIDNCDLYGCGTCGIYAEGGNGLDVRNTAIRECSEAIVNLIGNYRPKFTRCDFYKNGEEGGHLFNAMEGCGGVEVEDCYFFGNSNELFGMEGHLKRCKVSHEVDQLGETYSIEFEDCDMNPGQLTKRSDVGPGAH